MSKKSKFYMNKSLLLEETGSPVYFKILILMVGMVLAAFIYWAMNFQLEEVAVCRGKVETVNKLQTIQHLYGGNVKSIMVHEGQHVTKGQILLTLEEGLTQNRIQIIRKRINAMLVRQERLEAFISGKKADFSDLDIPQELIDEQNEILNTYIKLIGLNKKIFQQQIEQLKFEILELKKRQEKLEEHKKHALEDIKISEKLHDNKLLSKTVLLKRRLAYKELDEDLFPIPNQIRQAEEKILEIRLKNEKSDIDSKKMAHLELEKISHELPVEMERIKQYEQEQKMLEIKSPCDGIVQSMNVTTEGGVIKAGATIMKILPTADDLVGIIEISSKDIGHIKPGQKVVVKFATYDYGRYGVVYGKVLSISPTSVSESIRNGNYKAEISLDSHSIITAKGNFPIFSGLSFTADIHTGSKSMIKYLLRPIFVSMQGAMHER